MITIDQLLESVDLDFEPRWVTKDKDGFVTLFKTKPVIGRGMWIFGRLEEFQIFGKLKLAEFENKDWEKCIYEVPRKQDFFQNGKIEKLTGILTIVKGKRKIVFPQEDIISKLHEVIDAVNELKGKIDGQ